MSSFTIGLLGGNDLLLTDSFPSENVFARVVDAGTICQMTIYGTLSVTGALGSGGKLSTPASAAVAGAGLLLPHGTAPNSPVNGDLWTTTAGLYARINGSTVGPLIDVGGGGGSFQPLDTQLSEIAALALTDGNIIVGDGTHWVAESGATLRTSAGLGTGDSPTFAGLTVTNYLKFDNASYNMSLGYLAMQNATGAGDCNVALGYYALKDNTTGAGNVAVGMDALLQNTIGYNNCALGWDAAYSCTEGHSNVAISSDSLYNNVTGTQNIAIGEAALQNCTVSENVALGDQALKAVTTGYGNIGIGSSAGYLLTTGDKNIIIGYGLNAASNTADEQLNIGGTITGDLSVGAIAFGADGAKRGSLNLWDGTGGNQASYVLLHSRNGTAHYVWVEDDGTVKQSTSAPVDNADGNVVGAQT
jgi:hypothetical protein